MSVDSFAKNQPIDHSQREAALDPTRSFCVTAPAGSGKTELLSQRVLALLAHAQQPEEILAITFTRKAAAEMRERIMLALKAALAPEPEEEHKRKTWRLAHAALARSQAQGWHLLQNPQRLRVQTIDGLCSSLTAQMPVLSQFGGQPAVTERPDALYREAVDALLTQLETTGDIATHLGALLLHLDNRVERLHELLAGLLACRDQWLPHIYVGMNGYSGHDNAGETNGSGGDAVRVHLENTLRQVRADALVKLCENMQRYRGDLLLLLDFAATCVAAATPEHALARFQGCVDLPGVHSDAVAQWQCLADWLLTQKGEWRKKLTVKEGFPAASGINKALNQERKTAMEALLDVFAHDEPLLQSLQEVRYLPAASYTESQWQILVQLTRVLVHAVAQLQLVFQMRGEVDFTEMSIRANAALGSALDPSELMLKLDQRISHLLIDEFQDTSSTQFRLLKRLVEGWREHNESGAAPRTLFIVGDGMQSIYGFREAKVGLFLEARDVGVNQLQLIDAPLTVNFRSTPTVVNWNNRVFAQAFPQVQHIPRGAVCYEPSQAFKSDAAASEVKVFGMRNDSERSAEAERVVALVRQSLQRSSEGEVAILVRSRPHLHAIVPALQRAGIAFRATDIDPLAQRAHVQDLLTLLKALMNPADRIAWLALLRSPLLGLNNDALYRIANGGDGSGLFVPIWSRLQDAAVRAGLSAEAAQRVSSVTAVIDAALRQRQRKSLRSWLEGVWIALGGDLLVNSDNAAADHGVLLDLIEQLGDDLRLVDLEQRLRDLYARPEHDSAARVVVMTIHKSKGLEFDTVIVPGLDAGAKADDKPLLRWSEYLSDHFREDDFQSDSFHLDSFQLNKADTQDGDVGMVIAANAAIGGDDDHIYRWLEFESKQQKQLEATRLLYVAATRAINRLYLVFRAPEASAKNTAAFKPSSNSLLSRIWSAVEAEVIWSDPPTATDDERDVLEDSLVRVPQRWYSSIETAAPLTIADNPPLALVHSFETMVGTALHRVLELLARYGSEQWRQHDAARRRTLVEQILRQIGMPAAQLEVATAQVVQSVANMLDDARGQWLLSPEHAEAVAEWELIAGGKRYVIDRSFVDAAGTRWIIDYKNSVPRDAEAMAQFARRELDTYRAQLRSYCDLVAAFERRPLRAALYFPRVAHWIEADDLRGDA